MTLIQKEVTKVYLWTTQVRPAWWGGWQPDANTIAWYPLDSTNTINDKSWNGYNLTNSWITFGTNWWVDCANMTSSVYAYSTNIPLPSWNNARTISYWFYNTSVIGDTYYLGYGSQNYGQFFAPCVSGSNHWFFMGYGSTSNYDYYTSLQLTTGSWWLYTITMWDWYLKFYYNWNLVDSVSWRTYNTTAVGSTWKLTVWCRLSTWAQPEKYINWYMSNLIFENAAWTAQEISDYYDLTKWDYWIS